MSVLGLPVGIVAATGNSPGRLGNAHPSLAPYEPYPAADGHVIVAVANPRLWTRFCAAVGVEPISSTIRGSRPTPIASRNRDDAERAHPRPFEIDPVDSLIERLTAAGVPCGRVRTIEQVLRDPQLAARQMLIDVAGRQRHGQGARQSREAVARRPTCPSSPPPALGEAHRGPDSRARATATSR